MKGPWIIFIALFILIVLIVAFPRTEGFNSYNVQLDGSDIDYDASFNSFKSHQS
jgi:hypothetical protein